MSGMDSDIETWQELSEIYCNPANGYKSAERLYKKALQEGLNVSRYSANTQRFYNVAERW